jgi:hypothetical protein
MRSDSVTTSLRSRAFSSSSDTTSPACSSLVYSSHPGDDPSRRSCVRCDGYPVPINPPIQVAERAPCLPIPDKNDLSRGQILGSSWKRTETRRIDAAISARFRAQAMNSEIKHRHCDRYDQLPLTMIPRCKRYCCMFAGQSLYADGLASLRSAMIFRQSPPDGATQESLINGSLISCGSSRNCIAYRDHYW